MASVLSRVAAWMRPIITSLVASPTSSVPAVPPPSERWIGRGRNRAAALADLPSPAFDPPSHPPAPRALAPEEAQAVLIGTGYRRGIPGGHAEVSSEMAQYRARGLYPSPGLYHEMALRDPIIAAATDKLALAFAALPGRVLPRTDATGLEQDWTRFTSRCLESTTLGLPGLVASIVHGMHRYGFALYELVWEIEESTGLWRLEDLVWIDSWQVYAWVLGPSGHAIGILCKDASGIKYLPRQKAAHFARWFWGRNYEGTSAYRPLWWPSEAKRRQLVRDELTADRFGPGTRYYRFTDAALGQYDRAVIDDIEDDYQNNGMDYLTTPPGVEFSYLHGAQSGALDSGREKLRYLDHQARTALDDQLGELGVSQFGARAVGSEMRRASERTAQGLAAILCHTIQREILTPIWRMNGWPLDRVPSYWLSGFADTTELQTITSLVGAGILDPADPGLQAKVRADLGVLA